MKKYLYIPYKTLRLNILSPKLNDMSWHKIDEIYEIIDSLSGKNIDIGNKNLKNYEFSHLLKTGVDGEMNLVAIFKLIKNRKKRLLKCI
jgi:hypothetical protein